MRLGIKDIGSEFGAFVSTLQSDRKDALERIAACGNGFEGWLKFEFFMWLCNRGLVPHEHVGLECKVALKPDGSTLGPRKQCDLWVSSNVAGRYHYVELKAPFANKNSTKMLRYAGWDVWYMSQLDWAKPEVAAATGSAIVVGVGFTDRQWEIGRQLVREAAGLDADARPTAAGKVGEVLLWDAWTRRY